MNSTKDQLSSSTHTDANNVLAEVFLGFFTILWIVALILWITFAVKGMITEMWIANAFMWIGFFGRILSKYFC